MTAAPGTTGTTRGTMGTGETVTEMTETGVTAIGTIAVVRGTLVMLRGRMGVMVPAVIVVNDIHNADHVKGTTNAEPNATPAMGWDT